MWVFAASLSKLWLRAAPAPKIERFFFHEFTVNFENISKHAVNLHKKCTFWTFFLQKNPQQRFVENPWKYKNSTFESSCILLKLVILMLHFTQTGQQSAHFFHFLRSKKWKKWVCGLNPLIFSIFAAGKNGKKWEVGGRIWGFSQKKYRFYLK